jgi:hypothetical protein
MHRIVLPKALIDDGRALAIGALRALHLGIDVFFSGVEFQIPTLTHDAAKAITTAMEMHVPLAAQPILGVVTGVVTVTEKDLESEVDASVVAGLHLAQANVDAALVRLGAPLAPPAQTHAAG